MHRDVIQEVFNLVDVDGGGSVDYDEFIVTCITPSMILHPTTINNMFMYFGPNKHDKVKAWKILRAMNRYSKVVIPDGVWSSAL